MYISLFKASLKSFGTTYCLNYTLSFPLLMNALTNIQLYNTLYLGHKFLTSQKLPHHHLQWLHLLLSLVILLFSLTVLLYYFAFVLSIFLLFKNWNRSLMFQIDHYYFHQFLHQLFFSFTLLLSFQLLPFILPLTTGSC